jgi:hypothetical protein
VPLLELESTPYELLQKISQILCSFQSYYQLYPKV